MKEKLIKTRVNFCMPPNIILQRLLMFISILIDLHPKNSANRLGDIEKKTSSKREIAE